MNNHIHPTAVVDDGARIGHNTRIWHFSHVMSTAVVGENCTLGQNVFVGNDVTIGNNVKIQNNVSIYEGVTIEDDAFLGPSCVFTNVKNPRSNFPRKNQFLHTRVGKGASVGANATIICGCTIGDYALVGAGAVVTHDVKPYAMVAGNPAQPIGWVSKAGHKLDFDTNGIAVCPETNESYLLDSLNNVSPL
jgi:UDP-2-acetamido-3-amino-2,3-dideoxy-glucuronate N-acetyltransferase